MVHYEKFQKSLKRLQDQYENYQTLDPEFPELVQDGIRESVIQRFETCYDSLWKTLRRYLIEDLGIPEMPNSPKPIFRIANENNVLESSLELWLDYSQARIDTSHDYDGEKAKSCLELVPKFIEDAIALYHMMSGVNWK